MQTAVVAFQVRHGAALALREVLRHQADAAGVLAPVTAQPTGERSVQHMTSYSCLQDR